VNNSQSLKEMEDSIQREVTDIERQKLHLALNIFRCVGPA
jgi:hypothetical protein